MPFSLFPFPFLSLLSPPLIPTSFTDGLVGGGKRTESKCLHQSDLTSNRGPFPLIERILPSVPLHERWPQEEAQETGGRAPLGFGR